MSDVWDENDDKTFENTSYYITKYHKEGYRENRPLHDEIMIQRGFDDGFNFGITIGQKVGKLYSLMAEEESTNHSRVLTSEQYSHRKEQFERFENLLLSGDILSQHSSLNEIIDISLFSALIQELFHEIQATLRTSTTS